jgi:hypothetical protein
MSKASEDQRSEIAVQVALIELWVGLDQPTGPGDAAAVGGARVRRGRKGDCEVIDVVVQCSLGKEQTITELASEEDGVVFEGWSAEMAANESHPTEDTTMQQFGEDESQELIEGVRSGEAVASSMEQRPDHGQPEKDAGESRFATDEQPSCGPPQMETNKSGSPREGQEFRQQIEVTK